MEHAPTDYLNAKDLIGAKKIRQRLLTGPELRLVWHAAAEAPYPDGPYVQLLLLLGVRRTELGQATWNEIDLDRALWVIPPARMKSDEGHTVPLPPRAVETLRALPHFASGYVFTARGTRPLNDFGAVKTRLDRRIAELNGGKPIATGPFTTAGGRSAPACRRSASPRMLPNCLWRTGGRDWRGPTTCTASIKRSATRSTPGPRICSALSSRRPARSHSCGRRDDALK